MPVQAAQDQPRKVDRTRELLALLRQDQVAKRNLMKTRVSEKGPAARLATTPEPGDD